MQDRRPQNQKSFDGGVPLLSAKPPWTAGLRLVYLLYQIATHCLVPIYLIILLMRSRKEPQYRSQLGRRFGFLPVTHERPILIFAASLGETRAASPVIRTLIERGLPILLAHSSPAGMSEGKRLFGHEIDQGKLSQSYISVDLFWAVRLMLKRVKPRLLVVVEAELWPALLAESRRAAVPAVQINGNYTERAFQRDHGHFGFMRGRFWQFYSAILTKSDERRERYVRAGVAADRVRNLGELKFDIPINTELAAKGEQIKQGLNTRPVFMISSSVEAEEPALLHLLKQLISTLAAPPLVVWVPRSPQRFEPVASQCRTAGLRTELRSQVFGTIPDTSIPDDCDVLIGDSIGEMDFYYALADLVFVGATLVDLGGHNVIEPLAHQKPVVTGPSIYGITFPAQEAIEAGAMRACKNADELGKAIIGLFGDDGDLSGFTKKTSGFNSQHSGAATRTADLIEELLELSK